MRLLYERTREQRGYPFHVNLAPLVPRHGAGGVNGSVMVLGSGDVATLGRCTRAVWGSGVVLLGQTPYVTSTKHEGSC